MVEGWKSAGDTSSITIGSKDHTKKNFYHVCDNDNSDVMSALDATIVPDKDTGDEQRA